METHHAIKKVGAAQLAGQAPGYFAYANSSPMSHVDPKGLDPILANEQIMPMGNLPRRRDTPRAEIYDYETIFPYPYTVYLEGLECETIGSISSSEWYGIFPSQIFSCDIAGVSEQQIDSDCRRFYGGTLRHSNGHEGTVQGEIGSCSAAYHNQHTVVCLTCAARGCYNSRWTEIETDAFGTRCRTCDGIGTGIYNEITGLCTRRAQL
jgi:hypothetical protein